MNTAPATLFRYAVVGLVTLGVYLSVGQVLNRLDVSLMAQASVSFAAAVCINYLLQKTWVFQDRRPAARSLPKYAVMIAAGWAINFAALAVLSARLPLLVAQLGAVVLVVGWNALLSFCWVFFGRPRVLGAPGRS